MISDLTVMEIIWRFAVYGDFFTCFTCCTHRWCFFHIEIKSVFSIEVIVVVVV